MREILFIMSILSPSQRADLEVGAPHARTPVSKPARLSANCQFLTSKVFAKSNFRIPWQRHAGKAAALPYRVVVGRRCRAASHAQSGNLFWQPS